MTQSGLQNQVTKNGESSIRHIVVQE